MNMKTGYLIIGAVIVIGIGIVLWLTPGEETQQPVSGMPPGHPDINAMQGGEGSDQPSKSNVRTEFVERLNELRKKIAAAPAKDTTDVFVLARMLTDAHQVAEAMPLWERYSAAAPKNIPVLMELANVYYELSAFEKALDATRRILKIEPANTMAMYNLGAIYATMEKKAEARKAWDELMKKYPDSDDAKRAKEMMSQL